MKIKIALFLTFIALPVVAWASPGTSICLASSLVGKKVPSAVSLRASNSFSQQQVLALAKMVDIALLRVEEQLWQTDADPEILFLDGSKVFGLFGYNNYGSSHTLPHKTCLLIGTKGTNIDVIAHEFVHADIANRLGYWQNLWFPSWLNEGIAMQVDTRNRYDASALNGVDPDYVKAITGSQFYRGEVEQVVKNYAASKSVIKSWIEKNGVPPLLKLLQGDQAKLSESL